MHFSTVFAPLFLAGVSVASIVTAGASAPSGAPGSQPGQPQAAAGSVQVQVIMVGGNNGELTFSPSDIQAPVGSMVQFQFYPMNHSVAQSTFNQPCMPIEQTQPNVTNPLWSGFMPTQPGAAMMATYTVMINNTTPIWLYCAQATHCQKGMVAAINANNATGKTLAQYKTLASQAKANIAPGSNSTSSSGSPSSASGGEGGSPSGTPSSPSSSASSSSSSGNTKVASAASSISYGASTMALAGLLSVVIGFAL